MSETLKTLFAPDEIAYTGEQLQSLWAYRTFGLSGDSMVAFVGPCDVKPEFMRDMEDLKTGARIFSERMLHFIAEHFDADLDRAVWRQRVLMALIAERLNARLGAPRVRRVGDDLFDGDRKLSVSIATVSPVSALIHAGLNMSRENTPVPTCALRDYDVEARAFGREILEAYQEECVGARHARSKVRPSD